jgi:hypothetical protein
MRRIYFHEDDYCQIEILPVQNYEYCKQEIDKINHFSEEHKVADGIGWTDIYVRDESPITLEELKISIERLTTSLQSVVSKFDFVFTGYSSYREVCKSTFAYGDTDEVVVFFDVDEELNFVKNIWMTLNIRNQVQIDSAIQIFKALSGICKLILVDWGWGFLSELDDNLEIENYLNKREEAFKRI